MSRNFTEGALHRRVFTESPEERMDFAGAGFVREDAMEVTEPERFRVRDGAKSRALVCPRIAELVLVLALASEDLDAVRRMSVDQNEDDSQRSSMRAGSAGRSEGIQSSAYATAAETNGISGMSSNSGMDSIDN